MRQDQDGANRERQDLTGRLKKLSEAKQVSNVA
jgi:hypothetical protein